MSKLTGYERFKQIGHALQKRDYSEVERLTATKRRRIKELFTLLKKGNTYINEHAGDEKVAVVIERRAQPIIAELQDLGVHKEFSYTLLHLADFLEVNDDLVDDSLTNE